ncbi:hypothetical protein SDC9_55657 [bioreactor metagenome]|uniref:CstA N-terminal domain-containing protein n=1 Tax=bioreactor metagenome TaxID=1076179 RepID=A0A644WZK4_9ZZZZ|nr:carbon starvation protein A [Acidaminococcaceae bacterium]
MNGLTIVVFAIIIFICAYLGYGRWLEKTWGIDEKARTPAYKFEDGQDYSPASKLTVFAHQFSSITGAGPVTGPIIAAMFGWLPAFLWLLVGGVFFGAVQDFVALYASVKNDGKSLGMIIEKYVGKTGRRLFLLFCWLFTLLVIAAFSDIIASTFNGFAKDGTLAVPNAAAASISMLYIFVAIAFGVFIRNVKPSSAFQLIVGIVLIIAMLAIGIKYPMYYSRVTWLYVVFAYCFAASIMPMWLLMQPRDYLSSFLLLGMVAGGVIGILVANPTINMPAFVGFEVNGKMLFPILFITIACGAVSGFHSLVSSGTSSKTVSNEKDMLCVGYGSMLVESTLGVVALVIACSAAQNGILPKGTPFQIFSSAIAGFFTMFGLPISISACIITMCVSALAMTTIDSVARIGRMSFQELFTPTNGEEMSNVQKICTGKYFSTLITLFFSYLLCLGGYMNIWPLFGSANQLLSALVLIAMAVFLRTTGRKGWMLYVPMGFMLCVTMTALVMSVYGIFTKITNGGFVFMIDGLQLVLAIALMVLAVLVVKHCGKELLTGKIEEKTTI